jgi:hypothetical protein
MKKSTCGCCLNTFNNYENNTCPQQNCSFDMCDKCINTYKKEKCPHCNIHRFTSVIQTVNEPTIIHTNYMGASNLTHYLATRRY